MFKLIIAIMLIVAISIALLAIKIILQKDGRFPNTHISGSKAMQKYGVKCVQSQDRDAQAESSFAIAERNVNE